MKNDTTFVRMRSGNHLGDAKCRKRAPRSVEFNFFIKAGPLEAILVIFGHRALIFFCLKALGKNEK